MPKRARSYGGVRQQRELEKEFEEEEEAENKQTGPSQLALSLLRKWAWGKLSAPELQSLAQSAYQDGLRHPEIEKLASLGTWGKFAGNMQRDLMVYLEKNSPLSSSTITVNLRLHVEPDTWADTGCTLIPPHKLFANIFQSRPEGFKSWILGGKPSNIAKFWTSMKDHPILVARPELAKRSDLNKGCSTRNSWGWSGLHAGGQGRGQRPLMC